MYSLSHFGVGPLPLHVSSVKFKSLAEGQKVQFDVGKSPKGLKSDNVEAP
ncbi:MAG: cold-shock protein [Magnetococcales bacterium]|nr:cold-shock protein [Magnetococcales bacterium]